MAMKLSKRDREWSARFHKRLKNMRAALERLVAVKERGGEAWKALAKPRDLRLLHRLTRGEVGVSTKRQARYQRRMSSLLAGRE